MEQVSIKKNYIYNTLYEILAIISPLITAPYISRVFGSDGVGIYSYTNAVAVYFTMFAALGIKSYGQREIAQHRDNKEQCSKLFWELEVVCISSTIIALLGWSVLVILSEKYSIYYFVLTMTVFATVFDISWFWNGQEQFKFIVIRNSVVKILGIVLLFTLVHEKSDLVLYMAIISGMNLLGNISMWSYLKKYIVKIDIKSLSVKKHYKQTIIYFVPTVATSIYTVLDKVMIGWITKDDSQNGYYEQATNIINMCKTIAFSIITVVSSRLSFLFTKEDHAEIKRKITQTLSFVTLVSIPISFGICAIASRFVPLFFGKGYDETVFMIYLLAPLTVIVGLSNCFGSLYFTPSGQRSRSNKAIVTGAIINLFFNLLFINIWNARGAAIASLVAESSITVMYLFMARKYYDLLLIPKIIWKRLLASSVMFIMIICFSYLLKDFSDIIVLSVQIVFGMIIYGIALLLLKDKFLFDVIIKCREMICGKK